MAASSIYNLRMTSVIAIITANVLQLLLDFGAQTECAYTTPHWTHPLRLAATYGHLSCFILMLEAGADVTRAGHILHVICTKKYDLPT